MFRDMPKARVEFRLRPTFDLRNPRDAFRLGRRLETRKVLPLKPLAEGPLQPEVPSGYTPDDDRLSELRDEWRAEEREWMEDFREVCR